MSNQAIITYKGNTVAQLNSTQKIELLTDNTVPTQNIYINYNQSSLYNGEVITSLSSLSLFQLNELAKAISNDKSINQDTETITKTFSNGMIVTVSVGDILNIDFNNVSYSCRIMGFNHYDLTDTGGYDTTTATQKAGILFQTVDCLNGDYPINTSSTTSSWQTWSSCDLKTTLENLNSSFKSIFKTVKALHHWTGSNHFPQPQSISSKIFIPSQIEISNSCLSNYIYDPENSYYYTSSPLLSGEVYKWYALNNTANDRVKTKDWWTRDFRGTRANDKYTTQFAYIDTSGGIVGNSGTATLRGVSPVFCI